jgi:hypothetical protein
MLTLQLRSLRDLQFPLAMLGICWGTRLGGGEDEWVPVGTQLAVLDLLPNADPRQWQICAALQARSSTIRVDQAAAGNSTDRALHPGEVPRWSVASK